MDFPRYIGSVNPNDDVQEWIENIANLYFVDGNITDQNDVPINMNGTFDEYAGQTLYFWSIAVPDNGELPEGDEFINNRTILYFTVNEDNNDIDSAYNSNYY
ncbi:hypothetical protein COEREDRAFT_80641 [Coemansia reversa NRRL 1564]|uniref:Uncharacterized protein n=1 Tax=Coemansia reversa (strain ATCC 12441 / NRRL 1564) TaxID=763665 RepID=A0A2G5BE74_COERN|nr:hypothetical protein COEREDRAFT_80641 [Coemansia reversa NRRL 1564]|eukprot:PIA17303.1 hypothetical protein COEREDRAFT_80641 [Coemansia reversa NRRL 1564]